MNRIMNMKHFFAPSAWRLGGANGSADVPVRIVAGLMPAFCRAAMMLLLCVMTCAAAWAQTVSYTFYTNENKSYIVRGANYSNSNNIFLLSPNQMWNTGGATIDGVQVVIAYRGTNNTGLRIDSYDGGNFTYRSNNDADAYSFGFISTSKYISRVRIYTDSGQNFDVYNDTKTFSTPVLSKNDGYGNFCAVNLTLSNTRPVYTFNITYVLNGGTNAPGNPTTYSNITSATLADATKTGYTFGGWYDNAQFNGTAITEIPAGLTGDKTVYAKWTANTYAVAFNNNGGSGTMSNQSFTYDEDPKPLTSNTFTRTGYTYSGWNTAANGSGTAYNDGQSVQNLTDANGATVTLFAQWSPITYTVSFNNNGGYHNLNIIPTFHLTAQRVAA